MPMRSSAHIAAQSGGFEPQRKWEAELQLVGISEALNLSLRSGFLPKRIGSDIEIPFGGSSRWVRGKRSMEPGNLVFNDYVDKDTYGELEAWWEQHEDTDTGNVYCATKYKRQGTITMHPPLGMDAVTARRWDLTGCFMLNLDAGEFDYSANEVVTCSVQLRYEDIKRRRS